MSKIEDAAREAWERENGRKAGREDHYDSALERWVHYADAEDRAKTQAGLGQMANHVRPSTDFVSVSLPRNYPPHKAAGGSFAKDGSVVFQSTRQRDETLRAAKAAGEPIRYAGPGGE